MDRFYIIANREKEAAIQAADQIRQYLEAQGKSCLIQGNTSADVPYKYTDPRHIPEGTQCVLVLGGDGTLLQASRDLMGTSLPLLGINLGTLGYLAEIELVNVQEALDRLISDRYSIESRMMLRGNVIRDGEVLVSDIALNDIVIGRRGPLRVIDFQVYVNGAFLCSYRADGIIVSTATGSTGYSLSAGGPIVSPDASLMLMTAIAPHTLNSRPVVLPDHVEITVEVAGRGAQAQDGAEVTFDGDTAFAVEPGDRILIRKAHQMTKLVKIHNTSFVQILRKKMN